jgi:ABC-type phosphate transport system permease subunit
MYRLGFSFWSVYLMNTSPASVSAAYAQKIKTQYLQDFGFEKLTMIFAATTLVALLGIIVSLLISAWPAAVQRSCQGRTYWRRASGFLGGFAAHRARPSPPP